MAQRSTVYRAELSVADLDRQVYARHSLTLARHPSETEARMMVRLLAFALHSDNDLSFGRGLSTENEPDLWKRDATGAIQLWIEVGLPDLRDIRKASGRAAQVVTDADTSALESLASRSMEVTCTIQDGHLWWASNAQTVELTPAVLKSAASR
ncbi:MAG: YaeQ family protein [Burkholderiaceae bacterium]|nr:YaeQ family protein [Burkholderiaceae bacterium]